jgi:hypothetical protein
VRSHPRVAEIASISSCRKFLDDPRGHPQPDFILVLNALAVQVRQVIPREWSALFHSHLMKGGCQSTRLTGKHSRMDVPPESETSLRGLMTSGAGRAATRRSTAGPGTIWHLGVRGWGPSLTSKARESHLNVIAPIMFFQAADSRSDRPHPISSVLLTCLFFQSGAVPRPGAPETTKG